MLKIGTEFYLDITPIGVKTNLPLTHVQIAFVLTKKLATFVKKTFDLTKIIVQQQLKLQIIKNLKIH